MGCGSSKVGVGVDQVDQGAKGGYVAPRGLALPKKKEHELGRIKRVVKGTYDRDTKYKPFKEGVPLDEVEAPGHAHIIVYLPCKDKGALDGKSKGYDALWKRGTPINDCFKGDDIQIEGRLVRAHCKEVWAAFQQIYRVPITPRVFVSDPESPSREYQLTSKGKSSGFFRDQQGKSSGTAWISDADVSDMLKQSDWDVCVPTVYVSLGKEKDIEWDELLWVAANGDTVLDFLLNPSVVLDHTMNAALSCLIVVANFGESALRTMAQYASDVSKNHEKLIHALYLRGRISDDTLACFKSAMNATKGKKTEKGESDHFNLENFGTSSHLLEFNPKRGGHKRGAQEYYEGEDGLSPVCTREEAYSYFNGAFDHLVIDLLTKDLEFHHHNLNIIKAFESTLGLWAPWHEKGKKLAAHRAEVVCDLSNMERGWEVSGLWHLNKKATPPRREYVRAHSEFEEVQRRVKEINKEVRKEGGKKLQDHELFAVEKHKDSVIYIMCNHGHSKKDKKAFKPDVEVKRLIEKQLITSQYETDHAKALANEKKGHGHGFEGRTRGKDDWAWDTRGNTVAKGESAHRDKKDKKNDALEWLVLVKLCKESDPPIVDENAGEKLVKLSDAFSGKVSITNDAPWPLKGSGRLMKRADDPLEWSRLVKESEDKGYCWWLSVRPYPSTDKDKPGFGKKLPEFSLLSYRWESMCKTPLTASAEITSTIWSKGGCKDKDSNVAYDFLNFRSESAVEWLWVDILQHMNDKASMSAVVPNMVQIYSQGKVCPMYVRNHYVARDLGRGWIKQEMRGVEKHDVWLAEQLSDDTSQPMIEHLLDRFNSAIPKRIEDGKVPAQAALAALQDLVYSEFSGEEDRYVAPFNALYRAEDKVGEISAVPFYKTAATGDRWHYDVDAMQDVGKQLRRLLHLATSDKKLGQPEVFSLKRLPRGLQTLGLGRIDLYERTHFSHGSYYIKCPETGTKYAVYLAGEVIVIKNLTALGDRSDFKFQISSNYGTPKFDLASMSDDKYFG